MVDKKVIQLSKTKGILLTIGAMAFVGLGVWVLLMDAASIRSFSRNNSPAFVYGVGVTSIVVFGLFALLSIKKLFDNSPGLIVSSEGIFDNSSAVSAGNIPWADVTGIREFSVKRQKFISIQVTDPEKYASNGNALQRMMNRANMKFCGTPVNISANSLKISNDELRETLSEYYRNSKRYT